LGKDRKQKIPFSTPKTQKMNTKPPWMHAEPSHVRHEISITKTVGDHFESELIPHYELRVLILLSLAVNSWICRPSLVHHLLLSSLSKCAIACQGVCHTQTSKQLLISYQRWITYQYIQNTKSSNVNCINTVERILHVNIARNTTDLNLAEV
jgi:hypothetical protein